MIAFQYKIALITIPVIYGTVFLMKKSLQAIIDCGSARNRNERNLGLFDNTRQGASQGIELNELIIENSQVVNNRLQSPRFS